MGNKSSKVFIPYLYGDEIISLGNVSRDDAGPVSALIDPSKVFTRGTSSTISVCFEDGTNSMSAIGTDSNHFGGECSILKGEELENVPKVYHQNQHGEYELVRYCEVSSMQLRTTDPPSTDFTWNGVVYPLDLFRHEKR